MEFIAAGFSEQVAKLVINRIILILVIENGQSDRFKFLFR